MDKPIKKNIEIKKEKVQDLSKKIGDAKSIVFADYHGLNANQIAQLRDKVKEAGGELVIIKNTLLARALQVSSFKFQVSKLEGPTAIVFAYSDELAPLKELAQSNKTFNFPKFKFGFLGRDLLEVDDLENLAKIPSLEVLYLKIVGGLASPLYGMVSVLQANIRNLVSVLDQASKKTASS